MQDYTKLGVRSIVDKRKFTALTEDIKRRRNPPQRSPLRIPATSPQYRKRPAPTKLTKTAPDKHARRMTLGPQTVPRFMPVKAPVRDRRLSCLPNQRPSPTRVVNKTSSPLRHSPKIAKFLEDYNDPTPKEETLRHQNPTRLLDAYGIPTQKRRMSIDGSATAMKTTSTLEEYLHSRQQSVTKNTSIVQSSNELHQRIRVCVRKRPLSKKEVSVGESDIAPVVGARTIQVNAPRSRIDLTRYTEAHSFTFDDTFDCNATNAQIYYRTAQPLVEYMFSGGKATCFAYGQTGSGKTYTMLDPRHGLYVLAARDIFATLEDSQYSELSAWVGFYEIYQGQLYDLLNQRKKLVPRDDGNNNVIIAGLREFPISDVERLMQVFEFGSQARTTGKTGANNNSSRSHAVLQVLLKPKGKKTIYGKLSFIDLAGSERGADRGEANTKTRMEGAEINKSLLALKECIRALDQDKKHTPFRGSKLTQFVRVKELKGESDPRLLNDVTPDHATGANMLEAKRIEREDEEMTDSQSNTNSDAIWEQEVSENILDVDFPADEYSFNALETPKTHRIWSAGTPQHQEYTRRSISPAPEAIFKQPVEDPFASSQLIPMSEPAPNLNSESSKRVETKAKDTTSDIRVSADHIRNFIKLHRAQIKQLEECLKEEKKMIAKLSLTVSSRHDFNEEGETDDGKCSENYEEYLNDLEDVLERKVACVETLRDRVKAELGDEEDM
ncbi:Kinesin-like protein kif24 [Apophysomyces sp. BC1034]|nr:Kinesin-like protein kif24 [Apophysomyces sp. BC1015]KAG0178005.1 Kinesin-like protein kif24 [Apophysomyces sp. BC1021]KAG0188294.1 Kinesin-like protein kif24 [Apophysomyces sp. BC1034]